MMEYIIADQFEVISKWSDKPEEIVRCRDCKHYDPCEKDGICLRLKFFHVYVEPDGFCAWGERRSE